MKVILTAMVALFSFGQSIYSQDSISPGEKKIFFFGVNISGATTYYIGDHANISARIISNTRYKHCLFAGALLRPTGTLGLQGGYNFFLSPHQRRFDFLLFYEMKYLGNWAKSWLQNFIGGTVHINILPKFYINCAVGAGITRNMEINDFGVPEVYTDITPLINVGIGYNFYKQ